jgi:uncharacterized CHY-type Zn-finger protein
MNLTLDGRCPKCRTPLQEIRSKYVCPKCTLGRIRNNQIICESCEKPITGDIIPYEDANICQYCDKKLTIEEAQNVEYK